MTELRPQADDFLEQFRDRSFLISPGGEMWFTPSMAIEIIGALAKARLAVGRIEGAIVQADGSEMHPIDMIADASPHSLTQTWDEHRESINAWFAKFVRDDLARVDRTIMVSLFLEGEEDWQEERRRVFGRAAPEV